MRRLAGGDRRAGAGAQAHRPDRAGRDLAPTRAHRISGDAPQPSLARRRLRGARRLLPPRRSPPAPAGHQPPRRPRARSSSRCRTSAAARRLRSWAQRIVVRGIVTPYVAGQPVKVSFYRDGRKVAVRGVERARRLDRRRRGQFHVGYSSALRGARASARGALRDRAAGRVQRAARRACASSTANLGPGAQGQSVRLLQSELDVLHYAVPLSGVLRRRHRAAR